MDVYQTEGRRLDSASPGQAPLTTSGSTLVDAIHAPLVAAMREYNAAIAAMAQIVDALRPLTNALGMPEAAEPAPPSAQPASPIPSAVPVTTAEAGEPAAAREALEAVDIEVTAADEVTILEFEEQLAELPGVTRVSLKSYAQGKAILSVELQSALPATDGDPPLSVVCAWCGKLLTVGEARVSHGLCADCAARVEESVGRQMDPAPAGQRPRPGDEGIVYLSRSNGYWFESTVGQDGAFIDGPTGFPALTSAQQVLRRTQAKYPDRLVVISGDRGIAGTATQVATPVG
jgi:hypothetical protein